SIRMTFVAEHEQPSAELCFGCWIGPARLDSGTTSTSHDRRFGIKPATSAVFRLLLGGCVLQQRTNLGRAGGCRLRSAPTSAGSRSGVARRGTGEQVDRFAA